MKYSICLVTIGITTGLFGCATGARNPGPDLDPDESAAMGRIAFTRLAREQACHAPSASGGDVDGRLKLLRTATVAEIKPSWCKSNVHPRELDECVAQIQRWPCDVALMKVTAIESCKVEPLCGVPPEGTL